MEFGVTRPFRIIAAVAVYDGHDASILALNKALMAGPEPLELIYLGYNMGPKRSLWQPPGKVRTRLRLRHTMAVILNFIRAC